MTEELIATLGRLSGIKVISRTSVMQFKGTSTPIPEIAKQLRVDAILEGSVSIPRPAATQGEARGRRVRVNARLIHAGSDSQLWRMLLRMWSCR